MIIDLSCRLEMGVDDGRTDEFHPELFQVSADAITQLGFGRSVSVMSELVVDHFAVRIVSDKIIP